MIDRFTRLPKALSERTRTVALGLGKVPALVAHPDWVEPAPLVIWLHGRTASKEIDPGRYLRWIRAGLGVCAIDLPGHGERSLPGFHEPARTLDVLEQVVGEIDQVAEILTSDPPWAGLFDPERLALGGMSAGGMATLRRLCDPHPFACATVEATTGNLHWLYHPATGRPWSVDHPADRVARLDPAEHLAGWRPIPLLAMHSEADELVPVDGIRSFIGALQEHYRAEGTRPELVQLITWPETGAPMEHAGFGRFTNDAKNRQLAFLKAHLRPTVPDPGF